MSTASNESNEAMFGSELADMHNRELGESYKTFLLHISNKPGSEGEGPWSEVSLNIYNEFRSEFF